MTINNLMQAALYTGATISSVSVLAVALFASAAALERWLDKPRLSPTLEQATVVRKPNGPTIDPGLNSEAA